MDTRTEIDLEKAFLLWYKHYELQLIDKELSPFLSLQLNPTESADLTKQEQIGWLRKARTGLFFSTEQVSKKLNISRAAYCKYEENEKKGSITLATLAKAAEAMDCELVYAIRPKNRLSFSRCVWKKLLAASLKHPSLRSYDPKHRSKSLAAIAVRLMSNPEFKRNLSFSQRAN